MLSFGVQKILFPADDFHFLFRSVGVDVSKFLVNKLCTVLYLLLFLFYIACWPSKYYETDNYDLECRCWIPYKASHIYLSTDSRPAVGPNQLLT
jgi:hypothetical protein